MPVNEANGIEIKKMDSHPATIFFDEVSASHEKSATIGISKMRGTINVKANEISRLINVADMTAKTMVAIIATKFRNFLFSFPFMRLKNSKDDPKAITQKSAKKAHGDHKIAVIINAI